MIALFDFLFSAIFKAPLSTAIPAENASCLHDFPPKLGSRAGNRHKGITGRGHDLRLARVPQATTGYFEGVISHWTWSHG